MPLFHVLYMEYDTGDTLLIAGVFVTVRERFEFGFKPMWLVQGHDSPNVGFKAPYGLAERRYGSARASWVVINCLNLRDKTTKSKVVSSSRF
jgi:hypothetical protein